MDIKASYQEWLDFKISNLQLVRKVVEFCNTHKNLQDAQLAMEKEEVNIYLLARTHTNHKAMFRNEEKKNFVEIFAAKSMQEIFDKIIFERISDSSFLFINEINKKELVDSGFLVESTFDPDCPVALI